MWREKINSVVDFPIEGFKLGEFAVNPYCKDYVYDLYAVSNHMGGMGGGQPGHPGGRPQAQTSGGGPTVEEVD